ncbi:N-acetyltransferase [Chitinophaga solisilvae]|uniref:N-acetyltransferase n=1 Tax=Chitinophaga solisilvae TaxID=1233460 RepID=A0A3S1AUZ0_9BACT|nr:N-acetyltransferase [Chitinophaga solisilvae]NSL86384.1 N-acetyltransferase [Chitinophaga solisilvae]
MEKKIITKFAIVNNTTLPQLQELGTKLAREQYTGLAPEEQLNDYIATRFQTQQLINAVNSFSNQWLIVYAGDVPAGYARLTSAGKRPAELEGKRALRLADFGVLLEYNRPEVLQSLFEKCLLAGNAGNAIWIHTHNAAPMLPFFLNMGFRLLDGAPPTEELALPATWLIREK